VYLSQFSGTQNRIGTAQVTNSAGCRYNIRAPQEGVRLDARTAEKLWALD
jgi:hypothetical protein